MQKIKIQIQIQSFCCLLILVFNYQNCIGQDLLTFKDRSRLVPAYSYELHPEVRALEESFTKLPEIENPSFQALKEDWEYAPGNAKNGLRGNVSVMPVPVEKINLRHRILAPNSPLWYQKKIKVEEATILKFSADDGAQVFVNGELKDFYQNQAYHILLKPQNDSLDLKFRVLNNAMLGGLNWVGYTSKAEFDQYLKQQQQRNRLKSLITKIKLMESPPASFIEQVSGHIKANNQDKIDQLYDQFAAYPHLVIGPYLQNAKVDQMTVLWETDLAVKATFRWGTHPDTLSNEKILENNTTLHEVNLKDLQPNTTYYYQISSGKSLFPVYSFTTNHQKDSFTFSLWGDSQNGWEQFKQNIHGMLDYPTDFSVGVGDLVNNGGYEHKWYEFFQTAHPLISKVPTFLIPGNHDYDGFYNDLNPVYFKKYVRNPQRYNYFAWTYGNARFVALDPNDNFPLNIPKDSDQYRWFMNEIKSPEWNSATWHFIFVHQPPYGQSWQGYHGEDYLREMLDPVIEEAGIDFIISGHLHGYERLKRSVGEKTVYHVIVAGGGGPMGASTKSEYPAMDIVEEVFNFAIVEIDGDQLKFNVYKTNRQLLDRFEMKKLQQ